MIKRGSHTLGILWNNYVWGRYVADNKLNLSMVGNIDLMYTSLQSMNWNTHEDVRY